MKRLTIPSKDTHPTCKKNEIFHSDIVQNHSLKRGLTPNNYTLLGKVTKNFFFFHWLNFNYNSKFTF